MEISTYTDRSLRKTPYVVSILDERGRGLVARFSTKTKRNNCADGWAKSLGLVIRVEK